MSPQQQSALAVLVPLVSKFLLALDQSTQTTGYAIFKDKELLTHGHIDPKGKDYIERISKLRKWVNNIIDTLDGDIEIAIEDIQLQEYEPGGGKRAAKDFGIITYKKLAHVQGALLSLFAEKQISYQIVSSNSWKSYCKIGGRHRDEQKKKAQDFVTTNYKIKPTQDEADAICLGHYALKIQKNNDGFDWS